MFLGGADAGFAAKRNYLVTHGYDKVKGLADWQARGEAEISPVWGLSDRRLMENAKQEVAWLHEQEAPFSLTLLTLDIHEPLNVFDSCPVTTQQPGESVQRCSADAVAGLDVYKRQGVNCSRAGRSESRGEPEESSTAARSSDTQGLSSFVFLAADRGRRDTYRRVPLDRAYIWQYLSRPDAHAFARCWRRRIDRQRR